ncbi:hypothetical protein [Subtercola sp. YIM 133946]|uniref:hypothetical protein n=1 Tax=Subtercola sp. YIM 133946 TaxID=3118909 RepID=UPI002F934C25
MDTPAVVVIPDPPPAAMSVVAATRDGAPDHSVRIDGPPRYTIRTIERVGQRIDDRGGVHGVPDDLKSTAALAVKELLLSATAPAPAPANELVRVQAMDAEAKQLGGRVFDAAVWPVTPIEVDGTRFALWVTTLPEGFAAVADLGPRLLTMHGPLVPDALTFTVRPLAETPLPAD